MSCKVLLVSLVVAFIFAVIVSAGDKGEGGGHIVLQSPGSKLVMGGGGKKGGHNIILTEGCDKCKCNKCGGGWDHGWGGHEYLPILSGYGGYSGYRR